MPPRRDLSPDRGSPAIPIRLIAGGVLVATGLFGAYDWWTTIASHAESKSLFMMSAALILMGVHTGAAQFGLRLFGRDGSGAPADFDLGDWSCDADGDGAD